MNYLHSVRSSEKINWPSVSYKKKKVFYELLCNWGHWRLHASKMARITEAKWILTDYLVIGGTTRFCEPSESLFHFSFLCRLQNATRAVPKTIFLLISIFQSNIVDVAYGQYDNCLICFQRDPVRHLKKHGVLDSDGYPMLEKFHQRQKHRKQHILDLVEPLL